MLDNPDAVAARAGPHVPRPRRLRPGRGAAGRRPADRARSAPPSPSTSSSGSTSRAATVDDDHVHAEIVTVDHFGNLTLNVTRADLEAAGIHLGDAVELRCGGKTLTVPFTLTLRRGAARPAGRLRGLVPHGHVAVNQGSAARSCGHAAATRSSSRGCRSAADPAHWRPPAPSIGDRAAHRPDHRERGRPCRPASSSSPASAATSAAGSPRCCGRPVDRAGHRRRHRRRRGRAQPQLGRTEFVRADIRNPLIAKVIAQAEVDTVVHLNVIATPARRRRPHGDEGDQRHRHDAAARGVPEGAVDAQARREVDHGGLRLVARATRRCSPRTSSRARCRSPATPRTPSRSRGTSAASAGAGPTSTLTCCGSPTSSGRRSTPR